MLLAMAAPAVDWPAWRRAYGCGICRDPNLPLRWNGRDNVRWRTSLPDRGNSAPIVSGDREFVTHAFGNAGRRAILSFKRRDGQLAWKAGTTWAEPESTHPDNPLCSLSPVTARRRVIAWFGSVVSP